MQVHLRRPVTPGGTESLKVKKLSSVTVTDAESSDDVR
jgi:hypothetical protein